MAQLSSCSAWAGGAGQARREHRSLQGHMWTHLSCPSSLSDAPFDPPARSGGAARGLDGPACGLPPDPPEWPLGKGSPSSGAFAKNLPILFVWRGFLSIPFPGKPAWSPWRRRVRVSHLQLLGHGVLSPRPVHPPKPTANPGLSYPQDDARGGDVSGPLSSPVSQPSHLHVP